MPEIDVRKDRDHYTIYVNGQFHSTADNMTEVDEAIREIEEEQNDNSRE